MPGQIPSAAEILKTSHVRNFIQPGGPRPTNKPQFYGVGTQYMFLDSISIPELGAIAPFFVPDPKQAGLYRMISRTVAAPSALPKATLNLLEKIGSVPKQINRYGKFSVYEVLGACNDLSNFLTGPQYGVVIYSNGVVETKTPGKRGDWKSDTALEDKISATFENIYAIGVLSIGRTDTSVDECVDVTYASHVSDGTCGPIDDGTNWAYAAFKSGATTYFSGNAYIKYRTSVGGAWTAQAVTGIGSSKDPDRIRVMGEYLVLLVSAENAYYYTHINQQTGVPEASWTKVTTGIVAAKGPTDMVVYSANEAYLCGNGGYIYKMTDPTAGVEVVNAGATVTDNLKRIHGQGDVIVAVGASTAVVISQNRGISWGEPTTAPGAADLQGIAVLGDGFYWVCDSAGAVYYTQSNGEVWTQKTGFTGLDDALDIVFPTKECGFVVGNTGSLGVIFGTWDGGEIWGTVGNSWRFANAITEQSCNAVAFPDVAGQDPAVASDNLLVACLGVTGTAGSILSASASTL